jgi:hypothetical protein
MPLSIAPGSVRNLVRVQARQLLREISDRAGQCRYPLRTASDAGRQPGSVSDLP